MQRKDFIRLSSLGLLGLYSCGMTYKKNYHQNGTLGIQLYTVRDALTADPEKALEKLAEMGFTDLEIYGYNGTFFGRTGNEFRSILKNTGQRVVSSHHTTGMAHPDQGTLLHGWEKAVEDMQDIGAEYMVCSYLFPEERTSENYHKLPDLLNTAGTVVRKAGMQLAYHNHDFEFERMDGAGNVYDFILENSSPELVKMELDLYWIAKAGLDPLTYFEQYPGRFPLWHVKDMKAGTKDFTEIGNGTIDFKTIFEKKKQAGLKHWFLEQDFSDKDIFESITISKKYIQNNNYFY
ncbi:MULTISPECIES: sugar phosphate isomerase/epimerase family protein [Chryseobacterium]|uniref:Sugar phosphate isomerase/epimerase n=1 Tax=Chryseobacterium camelliae TaxID=1265445 RepID=A0ABU0TFQ2_9FLAO|nr:MULTISPECIES: sugar phosphate isomerase/epimerase [Chryseobacterium]MDT3406561.1 sugar phosphate isomerase/epimerase [Pseudacidovorax intermedius]MDQ1095641.1 sugar phosphate isomerase/epimerase [Chryseobacterium camelliae]MDQ1099578.1 sugar phosphate isomerase/epimerase [Chryseobacterium sp. SORGH_AS_1048]MDR6086925.1 sugar phosphate isomerase/epimerase [Chryseobacterium sp. SORGH_AS_0909]MDR6131298.1 sugar phosphate isomerase/epimerase [Chryseobacterium sp. SORGH_AS_1175]